MLCFKRPATSASASSQLIRSNRPSPFFPTRRRGYKTRSGLYTRSSMNRLTFAHRPPCVVGCIESPCRLRATPLSTVTCQMQESGQSWEQTPRITRSSEFRSVVVGSDIALLSSLDDCIESQAQICGEIGAIGLLEDSFN